MNNLRYASVQSPDDYNGESRYVVTIVDGTPVACTCHTWNSTVSTTGEPFTCTHILSVIKRTIVLLPPFPNPDDLIGMQVKLSIPSPNTSTDSG